MLFVCSVSLPPIPNSVPIIPMILACIQFFPNNQGKGTETRPLVGRSSSWPVFTEIVTRMGPHLLNYKYLLSKWGLVSPNSEVNPDGELKHLGVTQHFAWWNSRCCESTLPLCQVQTWTVSSFYGTTPPIFEVRLKDGFGCSWILFWVNPPK